MATNVQRSGLGFEKFFRRKSRSPEPAKELEKNGINSDEDVSTKVKSTKSKTEKLVDKKSIDGKNGSDNGKNIAENEIDDDAASEKTDGSKKSSKKKKHGEQEGLKTDDKTDDDSEAACKEYMIKDDVGQVKLTEIINNSIKEAVLNIVKEGVCPLADSKDPSKKLPPVEEPQDKENKSGNPKEPASLLSSTNKTFESHLCRTQYEQSTRHQPSITPCQPSTCSPSPQRSNDHEKSIITQCNRQSCPRLKKERKTTKQKEKKTRQVSPNISRQMKGSSHFKTDNRRMTGNVNIYICSEATENINDEKKKPKDTNQCIDESESASETKTCTSTVSVSTSKLVAALRKKRRKNLNNESLNCLCDIAENSSKQHRCVDKIINESDQLLCLCDDNVDVEFPDSRSSSSRDACLCEDTIKLSDSDFPCSDEPPRDSDLTSFDRYSSCDKNDSWPCTNDDCPSCKNNFQRLKTEELAKNFHEDFDDCPSCKNNFQRLKTEELAKNFHEDFDDCPSCKNNFQRLKTEELAKNCHEDFDDCPSCKNNFQRLKTKELAKNCDEDFNDSCSCCDQKRYEKDDNSAVISRRDWKSQQDKVHTRESRERMSRTQRDGNCQQSIKCPCIVEEKDEDFCADPKEPEEEFTVCVNQSIDEQLPTNEDEKIKMDKSSSESQSNILKEEKTASSKSSDNLKIASTNDSKMPMQKNEQVKEEESKKKKRKTLQKKLKESSDFRQSEGPSKEINENVPKLSGTLKKDKENELVPNPKRRSSFLYRSMQKAMSIVKTRKDEDGIEEEKKIEQSSPEPQSSSKTNECLPCSEEKVKEINVSTCCGIDKEKSSLICDSFLNREERSKSRISMALASRRSSATTSKDSSKMSISLRQSQTDKKQESKDHCKCKKLTESSDCCCKKPAPVTEENCKCCTSKSPKIKEDSSVCGKKSEPVTEENCKCCTSKSPKIKEDSSVCGKKLEPVTEENCKCCTSKNPKIKEDSSVCGKKLEPVTAENCKCCTSKSPKIKEDSSVCGKKLETQKLETRLCCSTCQNPTDGCVCRLVKCETIEAKSCKCCRRCKRSIAECKCRRRDKLEENVCKRCYRPERLCCCDDTIKSSMMRTQTVKCCRLPEVKEKFRQCVACCRPSDECRCHERRRQECDERGLKSMICIYCDNPQDICVCRAPIRKCSQCCLPLDICNCKPTPCCDCNGRQIVTTDDCNEQTMCVTAWKPRRNVRRYFARSMEQVDGISDDDCACWERLKPYGSDRLAYQKRGAFSDVMSELQQKISGSVGCNVCRKEPCCCCCDEREADDKIEMRPCLSTIAERRSPGRSQKRSRSKSPFDSCKCVTINHRRKKVPSRIICDRCRTSPCRCRRNSKSPPNKHQAKCYYCKSSPCVCVPINDNPCPFRNADSSNCRRKEHCNRMAGNIKATIDIEDNRYRNRDDKCFVSCPENQQKIRKYCYRGNSNRHPLHPGERVR